MGDAAVYARRMDVFRINRVQLAALEYLAAYIQSCFFVADG